MQPKADNSAAMQQNPLAEKRVLIFDWDGTLFDSMPIKRQTFSEVVMQCLLPRAPSIDADTVRRIYIQHGGRPRREIFAEVADHYGLSLTPEDADALSAALTARNMEALAHASLFDDAQALLAALKDAPYLIYISSSVPPEELQRLVFNAVSPQVKQHITGILGSKPGFSKGPEHVDYICKKEGCDAADCLMFGDDEADRRLSLAAGIGSRLIDRSGRKIGAEEEVLTSLEEVIAWL